MAKENPNYIRGSNKEGNYKYCPRGISCVYILINEETGGFYIGSTNELNRRLSHHFGQLKRGCHTCKRLQDSFNNSKYEDFSFYILFRGDEIEELREKEQDILNRHYDHPLLLNSITKDNTWINDRNCETVDTFKEKVSEIAKTRTGDKNPFYGRKHSEETKEKIRIKKIGKESVNNIPVVINGIKYNSMTEASRKLNVPIPTIKHRVENENPLFSNWYILEDLGEILVVDDRLLFKPSDTPRGLYEIDNVYYTNVNEIKELFGVKAGTLQYKLKSESFPNWKRII